MKHSRVWIAIGLLLLAGGLLYFNHQVLHIRPAEVKEWIVAFGWAAPAVYMLVYTVRPLILFPASLLSLAGGLAFGPLWGTVYTVIGATMGAVVAFGAARLLGERFVKNSDSGKWHAVQLQMERRGFIYIVILRFIPILPFDLVSYAAGVAKVRPYAFIMGTLIGIIPGTFAYNYLGSSLASGQLSTIVIAAALLLLVILLSLLLKKKVKLK
ncbi:TVP38/TMEM64 family protein [Paenibacillus sp. PL2-23]|uniref:TVP38/TMEM64 family protein n=1 Tax=Paenibacillus sp. PL2-23 TaxID=2100729 RepID=UPI0030F6B1B0